ncbi:MAG: winged helix DNA-binding domain-containing protein [Bacteroidota bacterium]
MDHAIASHRLLSQQLTRSTFVSPGELVQYMGAVQAQDFPMSRWALGVRLPASTDEQIRGAFDRGEILRTHVLRPTWHLVSPKDIRWMLELTAPQIHTAMRSRDRELGLTPAVLKKALDLIVRMLEGGKHLTREELSAALQLSGIKPDNNRMAHIFMWAETESLVCSGKIVQNKVTFALLDERAGSGPGFSREEALAELALRYFRSHGPATLSDFAWWSGLRSGDARKALESVGKELLCRTEEGQAYWFAEDPSPRRALPDRVHLLPAYDEYLISYKDRSASLTRVLQPRAVSSNGVFYPVILSGGQVCGLWKRTVKKNSIIPEYAFFEAPDTSTREGVREAFGRYAQFVDKSPEEPGK